MTGAHFEGTILTDADFTGAVVTGVNFKNTTYYGFTSEQLYSTASYQSGELRGMKLSGNDLSGWDFAGKNLSGTRFGEFYEFDEDPYPANLNNADLRGANLTDVDFLAVAAVAADLTFADLRGATDVARRGLDAADRV